MCNFESAMLRYNSSGWPLPHDLRKCATGIGLLYAFRAASNIGTERSVSHCIELFAE